MPSPLSPPTVAHAVGWRRATSAIAILFCGLLLVFAAASTAYAATTAGPAAPTTISITHPLAHATDVTVAVSLGSADRVARSIPLRHTSMDGVDDACPFEPDLWFDDDRDDDDDDESDRHGAHARRSATGVEDALGLRCPSRALGGSAVPDGSLPINLSLTECVRRM
jgi:hypothetical protein